MNYTMKQFLCSCCIFSILAVCVSCSKETLNIPDNDTNPVIMNEVESGEVFAKILATSLKDNPDLDSFIKTKTMEAFDGDNNFLIIPNIDNPQTKSGMTFRSMLSELLIPTKSSNENMPLDSIIEDIKNESPLLQVYLMNAENWNGTDQLTVAYLPSDYDEQSTQYVPAYDSTGEKLLISPDSDFEGEPMLVVSTNERSVAIDNSKTNPDGTYKSAKPIYSNDKYSYYLLEDMVFEPITYNPETKGPIIDGIESYENCYRWNHSTCSDFIRRVTISNKSAWNALEKPLSGDPELYVNIIYGTSALGTMGSTYRFVGTGYHNRNNIEWSTKNINVMRWDLIKNGKYMIYKWGEKDGKKDNDQTISASIDFLDLGLITANVNINLFKNDDPAGEAFVYYDHDNLTEYNTGSVKFDVEIR